MTFLYVLELPPWRLLNFSGCKCSAYSGRALNRAAALTRSFTVGGNLNKPIFNNSMSRGGGIILKLLIEMSIIHSLV